MPGAHLLHKALFYRGLRSPCSSCTSSCTGKVLQGCTQILAGILPPTARFDGCRQRPPTGSRRTIGVRPPPRRLSMAMETSPQGPRRISRIRGWMVRHVGSGGWSHLKRAPTGQYPNRAKPKPTQGGLRGRAVKRPDSSGLPIHWTGVRRAFPPDRLRSTPPGVPRTRCAPLRPG